MAMEYHDILVAVDGSEASEFAFEKAIEIAKRNDARLIIAHVVDTRVYSSVEAYDRGVSDRVENDAHQLLQNYRERSESAGLNNVETVLENGSPKVKIPKDIAPKKKADLIICGATGLNAVERFFIGSVSEHITRFASMDVLVVRKNIREDKKEA